MNWRGLLQLRPLRALAMSLADLAYPGTCENCDAFCDAPGPLCESCGAKMSELIGGYACEKCAMPLTLDGAPCPWCLGRGLPHYDSIARLAVYHEPLRPLIHRMKYNGRWPIAEMLADQLLARPKIRQLLTEADRIVPIPLHFRRRLSRGYNQAEVIARRLALKSRVKFVDPLARIRDTQAQVNLHSQKARVENMKGAFSLEYPKAIAGQRVIVIDDVMTTGATLHAAAQQLRKARPTSLHAIVIAIADPRGRDFQKV